MTRDELRHAFARAMWDKRPDCVNKPWPLETEEQRRTYPHNPVAACDLCFIYATAALDALAAKGCVVVPVEPTEKMIKAAADPRTANGSPMSKGPADVWSAMLSASKE